MKLECKVPDGTSGPWSVETFTVSENDSAFKLWNLRAAIHGDMRLMSAGTFKRLKRGGEVIMSTTPSELSDMSMFVYKATGNILINGLGLGMAVVAALQKEDVKHITVIEKDPDVLKLVAPTFEGNTRVTIIEADAFTWKPPKGVKYDAVWHDIFDNICSDNLKQMEKLHRKYARRCTWQDSWGKIDCLRLKRRGW